MAPKISLMVALTLCLGFAPAPIPRPDRHRGAPPMPALCVMTWCGTDYVTRFHTDGRYEADSGSSLWVGEWSLARRGDAEVLCVRERPSWWRGAAGSGWSRYEVVLDKGRRKGAFPDGHFSLRNLP